MKYPAKDARPGDVYVEPDGTLWRVTAIYEAPAVVMTEVEPRPDDEPTQIVGTITAPLWEPLRRVWRAGEES